MSGTQPNWLNSYYSIIPGPAGPTGPAGPVALDYFSTLATGIVSPGNPTFTQTFTVPTGSGNCFFVTANVIAGTTVFVNGDDYVTFTITDTATGATLSQNTVDYLAVISANNNIIYQLPYSAIGPSITFTAAAQTRTGAVPTLNFTVSNFTSPP